MTLRVKNNLMTNRISIVFRLFTLMLSICFIYSCSEEDKSYYSEPFRIEFGQIKKGDGYNFMQVVTDNDDTISIDAILTPYPMLEEGKRVLINYSIKPDGGFVINTISNIQTGGVLPKISSLESDPISVQRVWIRKGFINMELKFRVLNQRHAIALYQSAVAPHEMYLHHTANGDKEVYLFTPYFSFDITKLPYKNDSTFINLMVPQVDGTRKTYRVDY